MSEIKDIVLESFKYLKDSQIFALVIFVLVIFLIISLVKSIKGNIKTGNYSPVIKGNDNSIKMKINKRKK